jgi:hypothetical protein
MNPSYVVPSWTSADGSLVRDMAMSCAPPVKTSADLEVAVQKAIRACQKAKGTGLRVTIVDSLTGAKYTLRPKAVPASPATTLRCVECGSPDWISGAPGTSPDAKSHPDERVLDLFPADGEPQKVWCARCAPWLKGRAA